MVKESVNIVEKAKRLVELCRECSRDSKRKAPVWLSHVRLGCGLESEYRLPTNEHITSRGGCDYGLIHPPYDVAIEQFFFIDGGDIVEPVRECLECYSELVVRETEYDDMEVWHRGLCLLAEYCSSKREVYWLVEIENKPPLLNHFSFDCLVHLKRLKEDDFYPEHEFVRDCEDSGTSLDIHKIPSTVYTAWVENPDNRWVIRWKNIFRDIESASLPLTIEPPKDLRKANWFKTRTKRENLVLLSCDMLRKAISDGRLTNYKPEGNPYSPNLYSIQQVKTVYPEYSAYLVD